MNTLGRILVVFTAAASLGFAAFAGALVSGGPNWRAEAAAPSFSNDLALEERPGPPSQFSVKDRVTDQQIGSSTLLAEVLVQGRQKQAQNAQTELTEINQKIEQIKPRISEVAIRIAADLKGADGRLRILQEQLSQVEAQIQTVTTEIQQKSVDAQAIRADAEERRNEGLRLKNQLELLRNDLYAAGKQRDALADELVRLNEIEQRLSRRNQQLKNQLDGKPYPKP